MADSGVVDLVSAQVAEENTDLDPARVRAIVDSSLSKYGAVLAQADGDSVGCRRLDPDGSGVAFRVEREGARMWRVVDDTGTHFDMRPTIPEWPVG